MAKVKFLQGFSSALPALRDNTTFYWTTDTKELYLGMDLVTSSSADISVELDALKTLIGDLGTLTTQDKASIVGAINEVSELAKNANENNKVTIEQDETSTSTSAKSYIIKQGGEQIGIINIPKDLIVKSSEIVTDPEGQEPGTYVVITFNDAEESKVYINVAQAFDPYQTETGASQVQLTIDDTNTISAKIVANSITSNELAADAVLTTTIKDKAVTAAKLGDDVAALFDDAGTAESKLEEAKAYVDIAMSWGAF
ncbi:MAG: tail fiber protein [Caudoviricetes sp.]|nr:MAG: tail fiber protein [Caudoviricetes sp.]